MSTNMRIHTWPSSYYVALEKQWVRGKLTLTPQILKFTADETEEVLVELPLAGITEIKKEASLYIMGAITVLEKDEIKHWFNKLEPDRNVVFNIIEHFWKELLLSHAVSSPDTPHTVMGQQLIGLMECSQRRMEDTAKVLQDQSDQLDGVLKGLEKMESDLDVADRWANSKVFSASTGKQSVLDSLMFSTFLHLERRLCTYYVDCVGCTPESHCLSSQRAYWFTERRGGCPCCDCCGSCVLLVMSPTLRSGV